VGNDDQGLLYQGIVKRTFERRFQLADYIKVAIAALGGGLLTTDLAREAPLGRLLRADTLL